MYTPDRSWRGDSPASSEEAVKRLIALSLCLAVGGCVTPTAPRRTPSVIPQEERERQYQAQQKGPLWT